MKDKILSQFDERLSVFQAYNEKCKILLVELLKDQSIEIHHIISRIKNRGSLERKIDKKNGKYKDISGITDICGIRIITYLESDVDRIANIIEDEFEVDKDNSIDKRKLGVNQFGYKSLHYVASLDRQRSSSSENRKYIGYKIEIQIRSILQHAWAEIEHDLGYKSEIAIPENFKRSFHRLAALLETADIEFDRLKADLNKHEAKVTVDIEMNPNNVLLDQASLISFTIKNEIFSQAKDIIKRNTGCKFYDNYEVIGELEKFEFLSITTIGEIESILQSDKDHYLKFVDLFTINMNDKNLMITLPLFYFLHFLACKKLSVEYLSEYFLYGSMKLGGGSKTEEDFINIFITTSSNSVS